MRLSPFTKNIVATGGKKNDLQLWDMENSQHPVFKAKNVVKVTSILIISLLTKVIYCVG